MKATYIDHLGTDLTVCNAARVSFDKVSDWVYCEESDGRDKSLSSGDKKLINYLASHGHWTPFGHPQVQLHIKAPIFVARQLGKHQVGFVWNEVSRRYVDSEPELYWPEKWRGRAENKKQGSSDEEIKIWDMLIAHVKDVPDIYMSLIDSGVAPEQARMILPQNTYTEWYWTSSLHGWSRMYNLRIKEDTQEETREVAKQIGEIVKNLFPVSWLALTS